MTRLGWRIAACGSLLGMMPGILPAQSQVRNPNALISLVTERSAAHPGQDIGIAIRFEMEPGWHIYWRNPGESGIATSMEWRLPEGWTVDPLDYPTPQREDVAGVVTHVHSGDVAFGTRIRLPDLASGSGRLGVKVTYGICRDTCIPGTATLSMTLPVAAGSSSITPEWLQVLPTMNTRRPVAGGPRIAAVVADTMVVLTLRSRPGSPLRPGTWTFFPSDREVSRAAVSIEVPRGSREATLRIPLANCTPRRLNGVLVHGDPQTATKGYVVGAELGAKGSCSGSR